MIASHNEETVLKRVGQITKKVFALSFATYLSVLFVSQFLSGLITDFIRFESFILLILLSFSFTLLFYNHPIHEKKISRSDWALIFVLVIIAAGMHLLLVYDFGLGSTIGSTFLFLLSIGLLTYVWNGRDEDVRFVLFDRDHRQKFATYFHQSRKQWIAAFAIWVLVLTTMIALNTLIWPQETDDANNYIVDKDKAKDVLITPDTTATPEPTVEEPNEITPTAEPTPQPTEATPAPTEAPQATPTPTPVPVAVDTSNFPAYYEVWVLNGSGVPGAASEIRDYLEANDIRVHYIGDINFTYEEVVIRYNEGFKEVGDAILATLNPHYDQVNFAQFTPGESYSKYNVVVIHGE